MQWVATTEQEKASQGLLMLSVVLPLFAEPLRVVAKVDKLTHWCDAWKTRLTAAQTTTTLLQTLAA